jgi:acetate kinase
MMTRSGDLDPGITLQLCQIFSSEKTDEILNHQSGIKGICGISDMKEVLKGVKEGNNKAKSALDVFIYRIQKYIGGYFTILGGCDILIFSGAIGAGSKLIRAMVCQNLNILKKTKILAIKTDEELMIAKKTINN